MADIRIQDEGISVMSEQNFEEVAQSMPDDARSGFGTVSAPPTEQTNGSGAGDEGSGFMESEPPAQKQIKMTRKMKAAMKRIQDKVSSFPVLWFKQKAIAQPEWRLDEEEEEVIKESLSFVFDVLNVQFQIEALDITLTSIWWVVLYPVSAIGLIFLAHKAAFDANHPEMDEKDENAK